MSTSRRHFLKLAAAATATTLAKPSEALNLPRSPFAAQQPSTPPDYTLRIATGPIELAPNRIISTTTYNGQFPGPLLRFKENRPVTIDVHNDTDTPEQLHWHGQLVPADGVPPLLRLLMSEAKSTSASSSPRMSEPVSIGSELCTMSQAESSSGAIWNFPVPAT